MCSGFLCSPSPGKFLTRCLSTGSTLPFGVKLNGKGYGAGCVPPKQGAHGGTLFFDTSMLLMSSAVEPLAQMLFTVHPNLQVCVPYFFWLHSCVAVLNLPLGRLPKRSSLEALTERKTVPSVAKSMPRTFAE